MAALRHFLEIPYDRLETMNLASRAERLARKAPSRVRAARLRYLKEEKRIKAVTVCFTDLEGRFHMLDYDKKFLLGSPDNLTFDGSSIRGFSRQAESDLRLGIDWPAFYWLPSDVFGPGKVLVFGHVLGKDGQPYEADFRGRGGYAERPYPQAERLHSAFAAAAGLNQGAIVAVFPGQVMAGRQLEDVFKHRKRGRDIFEGQVKIEGPGLDFAFDRGVGQDGFELRAEDDRFVGKLGVIKGLDPESIPRQKDVAAHVVPDTEGEHAVQVQRQVAPPLLVAVHEHLGVRVVGEEAVARTLELGAKLAMVVDLAIEHDDGAAFGVGHGLRAAGVVEDRQPPVAKRHRALGAAVEALAVGSAVRERARHRAQHVGPRVETGQAGDSAHVIRPRR